nr:DUF2914 domain-containing protein [Deltaproteobacteria bacterium]
IHLGPVVDPLPPRLGDPSRLPNALARGLVTWTAILGGLVLLAEVGAIPPVPLALAEAGIFRDVRRDGGHVALTFEPRGLWPSDESRFLFRPGDRVFCFTAIFAPRGAELALAHAWERWDPAGRWVETDRNPWSMHGGRDGGWRSWTAKSNVSPGEWRVRILTADDIEVGRVRFSIEPTDAPAGPMLVRKY